MSITTMVSTVHADLTSALARLRGQVLTNAGIKQAYVAAGGLQSSLVIAADHCVNHTNAGACTCAEQPATALLYRLGRNSYLVLGR